MGVTCRFALLSLAFALAGCSQELSSDVPSTREFERTIVVFEADGTQAVTHVRVTREEQLRDLAAREDLLASASGPKAIMRDVNCAGSSMWIFDQEYMTGNEICFFGWGLAHLKDYVHQCIGGSCFGWAGYVRSYWAGADAGFFYYLVNVDAGVYPEFHGESFTPYKYVGVAGPAAAFSTDLRLGPSRP